MSDAQFHVLILLALLAEVVILFAIISQWLNFDWRTWLKGSQFFDASSGKPVDKEELDDELLPKKPR